MLEHGPELTSLLLDEQAHFYVCGDCKMAEEVQQTLKQIMKKHADLDDESVDNIIMEMMVSLNLALDTTQCTTIGLIKDSKTDVVRFDIRINSNFWCHVY